MRKPRPDAQKPHRILKILWWAAKKSRRHRGFRGYARWQPIAIERIILTKSARYVKQQTPAKPPIWRRPVAPPTRPDHIPSSQGLASCAQKMLAADRYEPVPAAAGTNLSATP